MTHIALIPRTQLFPDEHLTLVWIGGGMGKGHWKINTAQNLVYIINQYAHRISQDKALKPMSFVVHWAKDNPYQLSSHGIMVATGTVTDDITKFRDIAVMSSLDGLSPSRWTPHITGKQGDWRKPGERVTIRRAELRGMPNRTADGDKD